jgi:hypothetical protein
MLNAALLSLMVGCQGFDLGTTTAALTRPTIHEGNPVMRGPQLVAVKVSVNVGAVLWQSHLTATHPHGAVRWILPVGFAATGCTAGLLNLHMLRGAK